MCCREQAALGKMLVTPTTNTQPRAPGDMIIRHAARSVWVSRALIRAGRGKTKLFYCPSPLISGVAHPLDMCKAGGSQNFVAQPHRPCHKDSLSSQCGMAQG